NFFFGAFDPSARLAVDKPPLDLWLQVASVKLFGFASFALNLREAVHGTPAVALLYGLVTRAFGRLAGLAVAAALAVLAGGVLNAPNEHRESGDSARMA